MANIVELIKVLRERSGAGMMDCKKALEATNGDLDAASDWLREKGITKSAKKADRIAAEGLTGVATQGDFAAIVEVNSETDFVAKNDMFVNLVKDIAASVLAAKAATLEAALAAPSLVKEPLNGATVADSVVAATARIGEKISLRRIQLVAKKADQSFGVYLHMGGKIGVVTVVTGSDAVIARDIAMHVAASNPSYLSRNEVSKDWIEKETHIQLEAAKVDEKLKDKPAAALAKIVEGKVQKTLREISLLDQAFVKDPSKTVEVHLAEHKVAAVAFVRYGVGEGIEKKVDNFAEEVMSQVQGQLK